MRFGVLLPLLFFIAVDATLNCKKTECEYKGQCHRKGWRHAWTDTDNEHGIELKLKCTVGPNSTLMIVSAVCDYEGSKIKNTDGWKEFGNPSCLKVRCHKKGLSVSMKSKFTGCLVDGKCVARGTTWNESTNSFLTTKKCIVKNVEGKREIKNIDVYCIIDGKQVRYGKTLHDKTKCRKYRCVWKRKTRQSQIKTKWTGCLYKGQCKQGKWNDTNGDNYIVTHRCTFNKTASYRYPVTAYCRANDDTFVASGDTWDDLSSCQTKTCNYNKITRVSSVSAKKLGCNISNHGCIKEGETHNMDLGGTMYQVQCINFAHKILGKA